MAASKFLQNKAQESAERIDAQFGSGAYGGSAWREEAKETVKLETVSPIAAKKLGGVNSGNIEVNKMHANAKQESRTKALEALRNQKAFRVSNSGRDWREYQEYLDSQEQKKGQLAFDLNKGQEEIDLLQRKLDHAKSLEHSGDRYTSLQLYGGADMLEKELAEKTVYLNTARRLQNEKRLTDDAVNAEDFKKYVKMGGEMRKPAEAPKLDLATATYSYAPVADKQNDLYALMSENESNIYNYYLASEGEEKAKEYFDSISENLAYRQATKTFSNLENKTALEMLFAAAAGLDQFSTGLKNLLPGDEDYLPTSETQFTSGMIREDLGNVGFELPEWLGGASLGQVGYDFINTTANMAPSIAVSALTKSPLVGTALLGASASGNAYAEALNAGYNKEQARGYAALVGGSEAALGYVLGGISSLGGKLSGKAVQALVSKIDNALLKTAASIGGNMISEFSEEYLQEVLTPVFKNMVLNTDEDVELLSEEALYSGLMGALTAGILESPGAIKSTRNTSQLGRDIQDIEGGVESLRGLADEFEEGSTVRTLSDKVLKNGKSFGVGRLFEELGVAIGNKNAEEIAADLVAKNVAPEHAKIIAENITGTARGGITLNRDTQKALRQTAYDVMKNGESSVNKRIETYSNLQKQIAEKRGKVKTAAEEVIKPKELKASESGKVEVIDGGEEVRIERIDSVKNGKLSLRLSNGEVVDSGDVLYSSDGEAVLYETIAKMNVNTDVANELIKQFDPKGLEASKYALGIEEAYRYGKFNIPVQEMMFEGTFSKDLSSAQRNAAYRSGQIFGKEVIKQKPEKTVKAKHEGRVRFDGDRKTLTERQNVSLLALDRVAEALKLDFVIFESYKNASGKLVYKNAEGKEVSAPNGMYDTKNGLVYIDLNAGESGEGTILFTAAHELTHFIKDWSEAKFKVLADFLMEQYGENKVSVNELIDKQIAKAKRNGRTIDEDTAYEELVADAMEAMLLDGNVAEKLTLLSETDRSLWEKIRDYFADLYARIQDAYKGLTPDSEEAKLVMEMGDAVGKIQELFAEGLMEASENFQNSLEPGTEGVVVDSEGDPVAMSTEDGTVMLSLRSYEEEGRDVFRSYLEKCVTNKSLTQREMTEMLDGIEEIYNVCRDFKDKYAPFGTWSDAKVIRDTYGKPVFSVVTPNGEYKMNLDFSLVCKKRRTLDAVFNEMSRRGIIDDFELGQKSVVKINELIRSHGFETACALCFVDAKRFRQASMADSFVKLYNELVESLVPNKENIGYFNFSGNEKVKAVENGIDTWKDSELDFSHLNEVMKNYGKGTVEHKAAKYIKTHPKGRMLLQRGDFMSSDGFDEVKIQNKDILKLYNSKKGTGGPKAAFGDVQYLNEILKNTKSWTPSKAYAVGGVRIQSFSDYVPRMVFDYVQMIYDLAAKKLPAHAYTKETAFVKQFGMTGIKINMSLIPAIAKDGIAPGLDAKGNYVWAGESFDFEAAKQIQKAEGYTENCGTICVGVSYQHIVKLLGDPDIRMVIPYHKSGLNPVVAHMNKIAAFTDYTSLKTNPGGCQSTCDKDGSKVKKDFNFNEAIRKTGSPKEAVQQYLDWCRQNEYTPKFAEFAWHENYYKLIEDFTLYDKDGNYVPQREVRAVFPKEGDAFGSMKSLIEAGLEEDAIIEGRRDKSLKAIVDEIEKSLPKTEAEIEEVEVEQADRDLEAGVKYSDRDEGFKDYDIVSAVYEIRNNKAERGRDLVKIGTMPPLYQKLFGLTGDVYVSNEHLYQNMVSKETAISEGRYKTGASADYHGLGEGKIIEAIDQFQNPIAILESLKDYEEPRLVAILDEKGTDNQNLLAVLELYSKNRAYGVSQLRNHVLITIYEKSSLPDYIEKTAKIDRVLHIKEGLSVDKLASLQLAGKISKESLNKNVARFNKKVKEFKEENDIRYSDRDPGNPELAKVNAALQKQNDKLRDDVQNLKELLKIQKTVTNGTKFTQSSVEAAAKMLINKNNVKGDAKELRGLLNNYYEGLVKSENLTSETAMELAKPAADWLHDHMDMDAKRYGWVYEKDLIVRDLALQAYSSYWNVSTLKTVADVKQAQINKLRSTHNQRITELRKDHRSEIQRLKTEHKAEVKALKTAARQESLAKQEAITKKYQESKKANAEKRKESAKRTALKASIRKKIKELNKLLNRGTKERNVKAGLEDVVSKALDMADVLFTENYTDNDIIRNGVSFTLDEKEAKYMDQARALLEQIASLDGGYDAWQAEQELKKKLSSVKSKLSEVIKRERISLNEASVSGVITNLAEAYKTTQNSEYAYIKAAYSEDVYRYIASMAENIGSKKVRDMSAEDLEVVKTAYTMVLETIRNANEAFVAGRNISDMGEATAAEVKAVGGEKTIRAMLRQKLEKYGWDGLKPVYAMKAIGSKTLKMLFDNVRAGEDTWARDVFEAKAFFRQQADKYGYDSWNFDKTFKFKSNTDKEFELNLQQMMSLYAFSKRDQALEHLQKGGIVLDNNEEVVIKNNMGIPVKVQRSEATAYNLNLQTLTDIVSKLTPEQIAFVDAMQTYLSDTMGAKGNEVSMVMYGVKLFKEQNYFPLHSADQYLERARDPRKGERKLKNGGFTKPTVPKAGNPIVLSSFMDVWSGHVNDMSMYHAFVLPMEDFYRVFNYKTPAKTDADIVGVIPAIQNAYGRAAVDYIEQMLTDLNGGARRDPRENMAAKMVTNFKKASTMASMSVVIQQPSAIARAFAIIDPKYFIGPRMDAKRHDNMWEELKKYAPVAMIKEMGRFDMNIGVSTSDFIQQKEYAGWKEKVKAIRKDKDYREEVLGRLPALADEWAWGQIWEAVKRETAAKHKNLKPNSDAFLQEAGKRFTEVIVNTQVYDSVLSRSSYMRAKSGALDMMTSFMAEPTTTMNMVLDGIIQASRGDKTTIKRALGATAGSVMLNSALVSIVYAMRDDDENETFLEKYLSSLVSEVMDGLNPLTYFIFLRDVWSLVQGYDVERADMSLLNDFIDSMQKTVKVIGQYDEDMDENEQDEWLKNLMGALFGNAGQLAALFGNPIKNIWRDMKAVYNLFKTVGADNKTTAMSLEYAVGEAARSMIPFIGQLPGKKTQDRLYEAMVSGDEEYIRRILSGYKDKDAQETAIRKALRENDPRIHEAAVARYNGDTKTYTEIVNAIKAEKAFKQDYIVGAINAEINTLKPEAEETESKITGLYKAYDFADSINSGSTKMAEAVRKDLIDTAIANGETKADAEKSFESSATSALKNEFLEDGLSRKEALDALVKYCGKGEDEAETTVLKWEFEAEHGFSYTDKEDEYILGNLSERELIEALIEIEGKSEEEATVKVEVYDWHAEGLDYASDANVEAWYKYCEEENVPKDVYLDVKQFSNNTENDKDENGESISYSAVIKVMAYIDSMDISAAQKTAIARSMGWAEKTIRKYKLW